MRVLLIGLIAAMLWSAETNAAGGPKLKSINRTLSCRAKRDVDEWFDFTVLNNGRSITGIAPIHKGYVYRPTKDSKGYLYCVDPKLKYVPVGDFILSVKGKELGFLDIILNGKRININLPRSNSLKELEIVRKGAVTTVWYNRRSSKLGEVADDKPMTIQLSSDNERYAYSYAHAKIIRVSLQCKIAVE